MKLTAVTTQTQPTLTTTDEAQMAREDLAARLERLARRVRQGTTEDIQQLDAAYADVIKLAHSMRELLG